MRRLLLVAAAAAIGGCNALFGVDELRFGAGDAMGGAGGEGAGGATTSGSSSGGSATSSTGSAGTTSSSTGATSSSTSSMGGGGGAAGGAGGGPIVRCADGPPIVDSFDVLESYWGVYGGGVVGVDEGSLFLLSAAYPDETGVVHDALFDMRDCIVQVEVDDASPGNNGFTGLLLAASDAQYLGFVFEDEELNAKVVAGSTILDAVPWDPTETIWLRVREAGGYVHFESSDDGVAWDGHLTTATPAFFDAVQVSLRVGIPSGTVPSSMQVDSVRIGP